MSFSWQTYVDTNLLGTGHVTNAAILGLDGSTWATSPELTISPEEGVKIAAIFDNPESAMGQGVVLGGERHLMIKGDESVVYTKKGANGSCIAKSKQAIIVGVYGEGMQAGNANVTVENLQDY